MFRLRRQRRGRGRRQGDVRDGFQHAPDGQLVSELGRNPVGRRRRRPRVARGGRGRHARQQVIIVRRRDTDALCRRVDVERPGPETD